MKDYTSGDVAEILGISKNTLYAWLKEDKNLPKPDTSRDRIGTRYFSQEQVDTIVRMKGKSIRKIVAVVNQKGGVLKTTTVQTLGVCLAARGQKVLMVDTDPQASLTAAFGLNPDELNNTLYDLLMKKDTSIEATIKLTGVEHLSILPAGIDLATIDLKLASEIGREKKLANRLKPIINDYNWILIDCPPNFSLMSISALVMADLALIPVECEFFSIKGLQQLISTLEMVMESAEKNFDVRMLPTKVDGRTNMAEQVIGSLKKSFSSYMLKSKIRTDAQVTQAQAQSKAIVQTAPRSRAAKDYESLTIELLRMYNK
jgi:chromosome partitioning protein